MSATTPPYLKLMIHAFKNFQLYRNVNRFLQYSLQD